MGTITDRIRRLGRQDAAPSEDGAGIGQIDEREQAIIDRYTSAAPGVSFLQKAARGSAKLEIDTRRQQRAYAEKPTSPLAAITVDPAREMVANLGDRAKVLDTYRKLSPEQRQEALSLAPGIAQQLGDDRGGVVGRTLGAVSRGISHGVSQPLAELVGLGGTPEEIEYIRQLDAAASQEFSPARPGDPWYERGPLQAVEMAPWMATVVGGAGVGRAAATGIAGRLGMAARGTAAAAKTGELAGITTAAFPGQYAQEVDQLKELGMEDGTNLRLLAGGTAAIAGLIEGIVPNPFKAGPVPLTEGAVKAARQYLWEAAKRAPGEMSEEYLQGVTSGLGSHVAQYLDENAEDRSIADAFQTGWEQAKEAALPMAFLLGVPAVGGAGLSAARARRLTRLQEVLAKGPVSRKAGRELGIEGNQDERTAIAAAEKAQLEQEAAQVSATPPLTQGPTDASQVPADEARNDVQGDGGEGSQVDSGSEVYQPGQEQGVSQPESKEPEAQEVQVAPWQQTPSEYVAGETDADAVAVRRASHPQAVKRALTEGEQVPRAVLDAYANNTWAKKAIERLYPNEPGQLPTEPEAAATPPVAPATEVSQQPSEGSVSTIVDKAEKLPVPATPEQAEPAAVPGSRFAGKSDKELASIQQMYEDNIKTKKAKNEKVSPEWERGLDEVRALRAGADPQTEIVTDTSVYGHPQNPSSREGHQNLIPIKFGADADLAWRWDEIQKRAAVLMAEIGDAQNRALRGKTPAIRKKASDELKSANHSDKEQELKDLKEAQAYLNELSKKQSGLTKKQAVETGKPSTAGLSEEVIGSPPVSPDALGETPETSMGKAVGNELPSEARAEETEPQQPDSKWQSETRTLLEAVPALKGANVEPDEKAGTVKVTRPDGLSTTIHFNADKELAEAAKSKLRNPESIHGWYVRKPGEAEGRIYVRSDANHSNILNHEVMHWLEDEGVVTKEEVEKYGGREAIAEKYGKWAELKKRKKDSVFQRIYDTLEPVFSAQRRFFEDVSKRQAAEKPSEKRRGPKDQPGARRMEPTEEGRPADGKPIMPGDRFLTNTGRETTPYPKYSGATNRQVINAEKKSQLWLIENAIAEAESRGDDFNLTTFRGELEDARKGKLPPASKDSATLYVFGEDIPKVPKPFLKEPGAKPLSSATEQARENLRRRGKRKPSQAELDAETASVIREREADNKVRQDFQSDRDAQKAQEARREFVGKQKAAANPATVDSLGYGDIAQVNDDIERGRVSYEDAIKVADAFVEAGYLPQLRRDQIRKPTQASANQVNVDSGSESKVKPAEDRVKNFTQDLPSLTPEGKATGKQVGNKPKPKPELAPDTARIQAEREAREQAKAGKKQRVAPEGYAALPEMTRAKFETAWDGSDQQAMKDLLHLPNKSLRAEFERRTERKLPRTIKGTSEVVEQVYAARAKPSEAVGVEAEPKNEETQPAPVSVKADFIELKGQNATGVKQTIRVIAGERTLLMERSKHDSEWSIREGTKYTGAIKGKTPVKTGGEILASGIGETKRAKEVAQQIIDGTFDKDADSLFVREDTRNIGLPNAKLAAAIKDYQIARRGSFAKLLREERLYTDGRLLMKVNDKDRDAILKGIGETDEGREMGVVAQMMVDGKKALSRSANAMKPIGYRGGNLTTRTVVLQSQDGDAVTLDKSLHDTVLKKHPDAVPYFREEGRPVSYASNDDVVAIVMPMNMDKPDAKLKELVAGKYDFEAEAAVEDETGDGEGGAEFGKDVGSTLGITSGVPLAGPHRGMGRSVRHFFQRFFTSQGELPADVYDAKVRKEGRAAKEMNRLRNRATDLRRGIKKALNGRELTQADIERMNAVLRGEKAMTTVPVAVRAPLKAMRDHIDSLSSHLILEGVAQGDLVGIITESMGVYATRSYRVFDNPKWRDQVPSAVRNRAVAAIRALDPSKSDAEVAGILESLLFRGAADTPVALLKGSKLGSKDLSTFIARKDIPEWLRDLWGEYKDAGVNYARSVFKMAHLLANQQFLNEVRDAGLGKWLRTDEEGPIINEYGEIITPIAAESSSVMEPLNGLLTTPEIKKAFERFDSPGAMPEWLRVMMSVNYAVKYGKTVGSVMTHVRNTVSNVGFAVANGHWRLSKAGRAVWGTATGTFQLSDAKFREYYNRLAELGIVGEDVRAGELKDALRDASQADIDEFLYNREARHAKRLVGMGRAGFRFLNSLYQAEDGVWKIYAWENEKARYAKAYPGWSEQKVEEHAANIVRNTYPTYSKIPEAIKALRRFPLVGTFVSFPSEVVRTTFHTVALGVEEMQSPETRAIGAQRLAGTVMSIGILSVLSRAMMAMYGIDDDEDEDLRWFVPPWQENSRFVYLNKPQDATFHFVDLGYSDPHAYLTDSVVAFMRGGDWKDRLGKATAEFLSPFASEEILAKALMDLRSNAGDKIYNTRDEIGEQAKDIVAHLWTSALEPGTVSSVRRIVTAIGGTDPSKSVRDEVLAVATGQRLQKVDVEHSLGFRARDFGKTLTQIQGIARKTVTSRGTATGAMVATDLARMERLRLAAFSEMQQIAGAARRLGVPEESIRTMLTAELPDDVAEQLMTGDYSSYEMTPETVRQMMDAKPEEFMQRFSAWHGQRTPEAIRSYVGQRLANSEPADIKGELDLLGITLEECKQALKDYWKFREWPISEKGIMVDALQKRFRKLEALYKTEN